MLKKTKFISLILLSGVLASPPADAFAETSPFKQETNTSQQNGKVSGTVIDESGPVIGASVLVKGTNNGTITDIDGKFTLDGVKKGAIIQISFIGYVTQEIKYAGESSLTVTLVEDTQRLDEVVVTALGIKREKKALGYAMQEVKRCFGVCPRNQYCQCLVRKGFRCTDYPFQQRSRRFFKDPAPW